MSSENLDLVRSIYADWERGDWSGPLTWAHPEIEYVLADGPSLGSRTGMAGLGEHLRETLSLVEGFRIEVDEYRELDGERVLVLIHRSGRGKISGVELGEMRTKGAHLLYLGGGKVTRFVHYYDCERALADLDLTPEAD